MGILSLLTVVTLRQEAAAGADAASLVAVGQSLVALHDWTFLLGPGFMVGIGNGLILGYLMYRSRLVPRGMAVLGLIGGPLIIASGVGVLLGVIEAGAVWQGIAVIPEFLWELSLGIWLIVRGFNPSAIASEKFSPRPAQPQLRSSMLIQPSASKENSANFALTEFSEVRSKGGSAPVLQTLLAEGRLSGLRVDALPSTHRLRV